MTELPMMPFFPADWILDTQDLSPDGYTAYHRLLCHMWLNRECALPDDHRILRSRAGFTPQKWPHIWREIADFFEVENGQVHSYRLTKERGKARSSYQARVAAGKAGAKAKWRKTKGRPNGKANGKADGKPDSNHNHTDINISAREARGSISDLQEDTLSTWELENIRAGKWIGPQPKARAVAAAIKAKLVTEDECRRAGVQI